MNFLLVLSILLPAAFGNSESEKWSWPSSASDQKQAADSRKDIYYESINDNEKSGRIRVPTSYFNNRRPLQSYQVQEQTTNRPRPLSDEFSDESTSNGENYSNNINGYNSNRRPSVNTGNRFGPQQSSDFQPQIGFGQQYPGAGGFNGGPAQFPGAFGGQGFPHPGQFQGGQYPGQFQGGQGLYPGGHGGQYPGGYAGQYPGEHGGGPIGYQPTNSIANGILVGPGGPTGIIGRPYGGYPQQNFGGFGQHNGGGFGNYPGGAGPYQGFDGQYNGIGQQYGGSPYNQFGGGHGYGQGGFPGPLFDPTGSKNSQVKKVEKSAD